MGSASVLPRLLQGIILGNSRYRVLELRQRNLYFFLNVVCMHFMCRGLLYRNHRIYKLQHVCSGHLLLFHGFRMFELRCRLKMEIMHPRFFFFSVNILNTSSSQHLTSLCCRHLFRIWSECLHWYRHSSHPPLLFS